MNKLLLTLLFISLFFRASYAQKEFNMIDIQIVNLGDGQQYIHERENRDKSISGKIRIITGITSEYIDAEIKDGYPNGKWDYYANNKLRESLLFKDGYMDGKQTKYFGNGDKEREAEFKKGKKHGEWIHYSSSGEKREMEIYEDDSLVKRTTYYTNGNIDIERNFKNGKEHGTYKAYTLEGELKSEKNFVMGKQVGKQRVLITSNVGNYIRMCSYNEKGNKDGDYLEEWVENGKPKTKGSYINGQKDGKWTEWYSNGKERRNEIYKNGVQQSK